MRVRQLFAKDSPPFHPPAEHLFIVTEDGRAFERFSDRSGLMAVANE